MNFGEEKVRDWREDKLVEAIRLWLGKANPDSPQGMGDDCARVPFQGSNLLLTADSLIGGGHFHPDDPPDKVGHKLVNRNLSDIAAMGGKPISGLLALMLPADLSVGWLRGFVQGVSEAALRHGLAINGGDVACSGSDFLGATLSLVGEASPFERGFRHKASPGDLIWVTGKLGGSYPSRHLNFTPRLKQGQWLVEQECLTSMMDISDGLATDLVRLLPKGTCGILERENLPVHPDAQSFSKQSGKPGWHHAVCDGEDYELLLTTVPEAAESLITAWQQYFPDLPLTCVGRVDSQEEAETPRLYWAGNPRQPFVEHGFQHF